MSTFSARDGAAFSRMCRRYARFCLHYGAVTVRLSLLIHSSASTSLAQRLKANPQVEFTLAASLVLALLLLSLETAGDCIWAIEIVGQISAESLCDSR
jgi:hypothetical protein